MPARRTAVAQGKLLPALVEELARDEPDALWGEYPKSATTYNEGFQKISYAQFERAVDGVANHIQQALGRRDTGEPLAWLASNDPRCSISLVAAMKAGFTLFLISERNSVAANLKLFDDVNCSVLITTDALFPPVRATRSERDLTVIELPPLEQLLNEPQAQYSYKKDFNATQKETAFMVHTSGSTGFPKPVGISHGHITRFARNVDITPPEGYVMQNTMLGNSRCALLLPLGHPAGVNFGLLNPFFNNTAVILPLPGVPPTGDALVEMLTHTHADWASLAPLTLESISKNLDLLDEIASHLDMLAFSGGSLPKVFGDVIAQKIQLISCIGASETGPLPTMYRQGYDFQRDWNYLQFPPVIGSKFDPLPGGVFELVFRRSPESEPYQPCFIVYPDLKEFRTKDLFTPHPTLPDVWTHASRSDDVIVFINGEKVNPIDFESHVCRHPEISAAIMFGKQRFEAGLLIELQDQKALSTLERAEVIQRIWPTIETANRVLPAYAQISPVHICFTDPGKPVQRTLKNTIRRQATLDEYAEKINQVYTDVEAMWAPVQSRPELDSIDTLKGLVRESLAEVMKLHEAEDNDDFFRLGMNSLQVLRIVRQLRVKTALRSIQPSTVYLNPSITALASALHDLVHDVQSSAVQKREERKKNVTTILQKYVEIIDTIAATVEKPAVSSGSRHEGQVVLLTGSTGSIGSYILNALLSQPEVKHIYCLNRSSDSATVQTERNGSMDPSLPTRFPEDRVTFLTVDLSEPKTLGLPSSTYENLRTTATVLIHNAWIVDFNLPLQAFESQLTGVVNLSTLCAQSTRRAGLVFISSVSAVMNFGSGQSGKATVPEAIITNPEAAAAAGYAESKYIGERLIAHATQKLGLRSANVLRLGQIAGAAHSPGRWNPADWIPALIMGSQQLGMLPDSLFSGEDGSCESIDWLPIDIAADAIAEIGLHAATATPSVDPVRVSHLLNPHRVSWQNLLPSILAVYEKFPLAAGHGTKKTITVVPTDIWVRELRANATASMESSVSEENREALLRANPALRLLDFFSARFGIADKEESSFADKGTLGELEWEMSSAKDASEKLKAAKAIDGTMMARWVDQWLPN